MSRFSKMIQKLYAPIQLLFKGTTVLCCVCSLNITAAQVSLNQLSMDQGALLCQPGVVNKSPGKGASISYILVPNYSLNSIASDARSKVKHNERWEAMFKVPLVLQPHFKAMLSFKYSLERFDLKNVDETSFPLLKRLNESELKTAETALFFVLPINRKFYTSYRFSASFNGDYHNFINLDNRYALYSAAAVLGIKVRENLEYGGGLLYSRRFGESRAVPFGFYNRTFNDHWGLELTIPVSLKARYNFSKRFLMLFGTEYSSQRYALAVKEPVSNPFLPQGQRAPYQYYRSTFNLTNTLYYQLTGWTWLQCKFGYAFGVESKATHMSTNTDYNLSASNSLLGVMSVFLTPPKYAR